MSVIRFVIIKIMLALLLILVSAGLLIMLFTAIGRRKKQPEETVAVSDKSEICCGAHAVCIKKQLLDKSEKPVYFDDEELDILKDIKPENYTAGNLEMISEVFFTLQTNDISPWIHSLYLRNISLPENLKKKALEIIAESREKL